jgi:multidrug efflux system membrane fusion protein
MSSPVAARRPWLAYGLLALVFAGAIGYFGFWAEAPKRPGNPWRQKGNASTPVPVRAVAAGRQNLSVHLRAIGTVVPLNTVTVRSRVEGQLLRVAFTESQQVTAGQLLAEIDPQTYEIRLAQAEARLRQNQAQMQTVKSDLERFKQLHAQNLVTQQQLEAQQALFAEREGALAADQAAVDDARRQLAYTKIEAPIAGRLGLRQVDAGNLIRPGDSGGLVTITQTRPIAVTFTIPENEIQNVVAPLRAGESLDVEAWDRTEQTRLAAGQLRTVDNQIDIATGTLRLKAEFPNADEKLFPNQFVNIRLRVRTLTNAVVVPGAVVQFGSRGSYVYVIGADSKATVRDVVLGPSDGALQSIVKGLEGGEQVVIEGLDRLRDGRLVIPVGDTPMKAPAPGGEAGERGGRSGKKKKGP